MARQRSSFSTTEVSLDGHPSGGQLEVFVFNTTVQIRTAPDDQMNQVTMKVADAINRNTSLQKQAVKAKVGDSKVILTNIQEYDVWIRSTDEGINIPEKPLDLVCSVEPDDQLVVFRWNNPDGGYDRVHIVGGGIPIAEGLPGSANSFEYDYSDGFGYVYPGKHVYRVVGVKRGTPSCPAFCEIVLKRH